MKKKYYSLDNLLSCKCYWNILYGMRSNGKSYAVKKYCLEDVFNNENGFIYLRRWSEDIKTKDVASYFDDMPVKVITKGKWDGIVAWQGFFYWYTKGEDGKPKRDNKPIGRYCSLNQAERYKSQVFQNVQNIIYEEFLTNKIYLGSSTNPEPAMLMQFVSTVARDRNIIVFMIGNTISRVCPYFDYFALKGIMQQKPGTIDIYHLNGENGVVDIAVENCEVVASGSKMFFGLASKQIISGEWEVNEVNKLVKPYQFYDMLYEVLVTYNDFSYVMQLMNDPETGGSFVYIYPRTTDRKVLRIITNQFNPDPFVSNGLNPRIPAEVLMSECFRTGKVCYSDNLTGTDFRQILEQYNLKGLIVV